MKTFCRFAAASAVGLLGLVGCQSSGTSDATMDRGGSSPAVKASGRDGGTDRRTVANGQVLSSLAYPTGDRATSIVMLEATGPEEVRVGQAYSYSLKVTNLTDTPLHGVQVQDLHQNMATSGTAATRPANARMAGGGTGAGTGEAQLAGYRGDGASAGASAAGAGAARSVWAVGTLGPKESKTQQLNGTADEVGTVGQCLAVSYNPTLCTALRVVKPELAVTKEGPPDVLICQDINYVYRVTNTGTGVAQAVRVTDALPEGLQTADGQKAVSADAGDLKAGETKEVTVKLRAARTGQFASRATAQTAGANVQSRQVSTTVREPVLAVNVEGPEAQYVGQAVNYRVTVRNTGDAPAEKTVLRFTSAGGTDKVADRDVGTIPPGETRSIPVTVGGGRTAGNVSLTATAEAVCARQVNDVATVAVRTIPALQLECVDGQDPVRVGTNAVYTITVRNEGSGPDNNVRVRAILPPELKFVRAGGTTPGSIAGQTLTFGPLPTLAPAATATWTVEATAAAAGDVRFAIDLQSDSMTQPAVETEPTKLFSGDAALDPAPGAAGNGPGSGAAATRPTR